MSNKKMSEVFELPLVSDFFTGQLRVSIGTDWIKIYGATGDEFDSIVHAVNSHDELVGELKAKDEVIKVAKDAMDDVIKNYGIGGATIIEQALSQIQALETGGEL